jgi:molecular chaperone DnaK (HSP70)
MSDEPTMLEQLLEAMEQCKTVIREAHKATTDLRQATKQAREVGRELQRDEFEPFLREQFAKASEQISKATSDGVAEASQQVIAKFERLSNLLMHGNAQGRGEGLEPAIRRRAEQRHGGDGR